MASNAGFYPKPSGGHHCLGTGKIGDLMNPTVCASGGNFLRDGVECPPSLEKTPAAAGPMGCSGSQTLL